MQTVSVVEAREQFSELIARVAYGGQRIVVERHGKPMVALVNMADLHQLEETGSEVEQRKLERMEALAQAAATREQILQRRGGMMLPDSAVELTALREERVHEIASGR